MAAAMQLCYSNLNSPIPTSSSKKQSNNSHNLHHLLFNRRAAVTSALSITLLLVPDAASPFELRMTVPDQTVEEAEAVVREHARDLIQIKALIESQSWREAQIALRESSAYLKQDLYTIIQAKPASLRPMLRKLYSNLFNNVSKLDYAARSKDANVVKICYDNVATTIDEIFAKI